MKHAVIASVAIMLATSASAQQSSLVGGTWIHSEDVPDLQHPGGRTKLVYIAQFLPDGRLIFKTVTANAFASGELTTIYRYQLTGPNSYSEVAVDFEPREICGGGFCQPATPVVPMGTRGDCTYQFDDAEFVSIGCGDGGAIRFSRH